MNLSKFTLGMLALSIAPGAWASSICNAVVGNVVTNCGFEGGVYSSTLSTFTNGDVPNSWTPNSAFDEFPGFNQVTSGNPNSGTYALLIGNGDAAPTPTLSQTFSDTSGVTYDGSLYISYGGAGQNDSAASFQTLIDGTTKVNLNDSASVTYTQFTFAFVGTGSDTITLQGNTNPSEWEVDDIVITAAGSSTTPEPGSLAFVAAGFLVLFWRLGSRKAEGRSLTAKPSR
jgi:hypothetical protein